MIIHPGINTILNAFPSNPILLNGSEILELMAKGLKKNVSNSKSDYKPINSKISIIINIIYLHGLVFHMTYKLLHNKI